MLQIGVMVSGQGRGTNLQAILDGCADGRIDGQVALVIGTRRDAPALERAESAGCKTIVVSPRKYEGDDEGYGKALLRALSDSSVGLICLAGYMRVLPGAVVAAYPARILNIHPSLLPKYGGRGMYGHYVHEAVIAARDSESGCTVHFVDEHYDTGPILLQSRVPVLPEDTPETLSARVLAEEHRTFVEAIQLIALDRVRLQNGVVAIDR